jgi:SNF2 family DNA or RNA helicase
MLMKAITLRRTKSDKVDGKPILELPIKEEHTINLDLSLSERQLYNEIHKTGKEVFETLKRSGLVLAKFASLLKAILMMRQACLHRGMVKFNKDEFLRG